LSCLNSVFFSPSLCTVLVLHLVCFTCTPTTLNSTLSLHDALPISQFDAYAWTHTGTPDTIRAIVQFDLTSIPVGATIQSAFITLDRKSTRLNSSHQIIPYAVFC